MLTYFSRLQKTFVWKTIFVVIAEIFMRFGRIGMEHNE